MLAPSNIKKRRHTLPTEEKNSSKSSEDIRDASCMQTTVLASRSSGFVSSISGFLHTHPAADSVTTNTHTYNCTAIFHIDQEKTAPLLKFSIHSVPLTFKPTNLQFFLDIYWMLVVYSSIHFSNWQPKTRQVQPFWKNWKNPKNCNKTQELDF